MKQIVGKCIICGITHFRENANDWWYHDSKGIVCRKHIGVEAWYKKLVKKAEDEIRNIS